MLHPPFFSPSVPSLYSFSLPFLRFSAAAAAAAAAAAVAAAAVAILATTLHSAYRDVVLLALGPLQFERHGPGLLLGAALHACRRPVSQEARS